MIGSRALLVLLLVCLGGTASAADRVRVAKAVSTGFSFLPVDVGRAEGIFERYGIDIAISGAAGDAKLQQALASGSVDFGLGSGPAMAFAVKGSPVIAVAAYAREPRDISLTVAADSSYRTVADLKGKLFSVSTTGSLTEWLAKRIALAEGWGPHGIRIVALGDTPTQNAALLAHQIDAEMGSTDGGFQLEEKGRVRLLVGMEKFVPTFVDHVIFARKALVAENPDLVRRFLTGFFASVVFMRQHENETVRIAMPVQNEDRAVLTKAYDQEMPMMETDGVYDPAGLTLIKQSFIEMGTLDKIPPDSAILTRQFVPVTP